MAVIIENMEMPNRCDECPISSLSNECPFLHIDCDEEIGGRDENCPLKEVPTGEWIDNTHTSGCGITFLDYECDYCHEHTDTPYDYCPNCGAKMIKA